MMEDWCMCPKCGHKLFMLKQFDGRDPQVLINIKCSSCKEILDVLLKKDQRKVTANEKI